jgi:hypothetical protein
MSKVKIKRNERYKERHGACILQMVGLVFAPPRAVPLLQASRSSIMLLGLGCYRVCTCALIGDRPSHLINVDTGLWANRY